MNANSKKSLAWSMVLVLLGVAALFGGTNWLALLIPVAASVWYGTKPTLRTGRN